MKYYCSQSSWAVKFIEVQNRNWVPCILLWNQLTEKPHLSKYLKWMCNFYVKPYDMLLKQKVVLTKVVIKILKCNAVSVSVKISCLFDGSNAVSIFGRKCGSFGRRVTILAIPFFSLTPHHWWALQSSILWAGFDNQWWTFSKHI